MLDTVVGLELFVCQQVCDVCEAFGFSYVSVVCNSGYIASRR